MSHNKKLDTTAVGDVALNLSEYLNSQIVGQSEAITTITESFETHRAGMSRHNRPICSFLASGPTGVGKTALIEALTHFVGGDYRRLIKIDCAEFQHSHEIAKLQGSPPGYLGHRETMPLLNQGRIANAQRESPYGVAVILFDEIEKAHSAFFRITLGIMDRAKMTLGDNTVVNFENCMIFFTSNLGYSEDDKKKTISFCSEPQTAAYGEDRAIKKHFSPEFINRLDSTLHFNALTRPQVEVILDMELVKLQNRIIDSKRLINLIVSQAAKDQLLKTGFSREYGARHLQREIEREIVRPMVRIINSGQISNFSDLEVDYADGRFEFYGCDSSIVENSTIVVPKVLRNKRVAA